MSLIARLAAALCAVVIVASAAGRPSLAQDMRLQGSGASFPFPLYAAWFKDFSKKTPGVTVDYQAKGSGAGIALWRANTL